MQRLLLPSEDSYEPAAKTDRCVGNRRFSDDFTQASLECLIGSMVSKFGKSKASMTSRTSQNTSPATSFQEDSVRSSKALFQFSKALLYERKVAQSNLQSLEKQYRREEKKYMLIAERFSQLKKEYAKLKAKNTHRNIRVTSVMEIHKLAKNSDEADINRLAEKHVKYVKNSVSVFLPQNLEAQRQTELETMRSLLQEELAQCAELRQLNEQLELEIKRQRELHETHNRKLGYWDEFLELQDQNKSLKKIVRDMESIWMAGLATSQK